MDSFEINKVAGAVLGTLLFAFGTGFLAELIYTPKAAGTAGYALPGGGEGGHGGAAPAAGGEAAAAGSIATRLASADPEKGKAGTKACQACHSFEKGGPNKAGPDLWEVVGRKKGSHEGFAYSDAMKAKGGDWSYEDLDHFLTKPSEYVKGTKMAFQGISAPAERANVIAYLRTLAESPKPLPAAETKEEGKKDEAKPAEGDKKADAKPAEGEKKPDAKPADGAKKTEDAKPADNAPAPAQQPQGVKGQGAGQQNEPAPSQAPEAKPAEAAKPDEKPSAPPATEPAAKPDPAAEEKAKQEQKPDEKPAQQ
ncbi:c-type cytochrome [Methylobacterium gnaphalii]|uniref:Cysteine desulfurase n=1 Tax=Methylobacterium gnaphalii TaxID=1010610 RepID=A0A512JGS9_9HYPH|nr:cytochrome c family protein [Methylobacterium gnaphalii]GEP09170.1 cysteine desulfurase [Methylobacterium gnaphalii]GJD67582.1 hypothetical protein MMMDOFMJ_0498 [Methylobacterium gnaphalii]GLS50493.1 cysteine desulfurase [Methylobacterium gnaphalii]